MEEWKMEAIKRLTDIIHFAGEAPPPLPEAQKIAKKVVPKINHWDGYIIAKMLEAEGISPNADMVDQLDFLYLYRHQLKTKQKEG